MEQEIIQEIFNLSKDRELFIFGAGEYGMNLYLELKGNNIEIFGFLDNNLGNKIKKIDNIFVYEVSILKKVKNPFIVISILNNKAAQEIATQLKSLNYIYKIDYIYLNSYHNKFEFPCTNCLSFVPAGHYYSPIPNIEELEQEGVFEYREDKVEGINLNDGIQRYFFDSIKEYYKEIPFDYEKKDGLRYCYNNNFYPFLDAIFLYGMMRKVKPKRIIEVGSGWSSCLMLDTNELFFNNQINLTFIEPNTERLESLVKTQGLKNITLIREEIQKVDISIIKELQKDDILFIDSTHVSKIGSDVNHLFFHVLPALNKGVYIHLHDIFFPFEYPEKWIYEGRAWTENYLLRCFLQYNDTFEIVAMNTYLLEKYREEFYKDFPKYYESKISGSIWIKKT